MVIKYEKRTRDLLAKSKTLPIPQVPFSTVNNIIEKTVFELRELAVPSFGSRLPQDFDSCYRSLVIHRSTTKFCRPGSKRELRKVAYDSYKLYEESLSNHPTVDLKDPLMRQIRASLKNWTRNFNIDEVLRNSPIRFSPGETYIASKGETSVQAKLSKREHWTVTGNCLDDACKLIYFCRGLKMAAKSFFPTLSKRERNHLFTRFRHLPDVGFRVFRYLLITHVLTIVDGARASSVSKNDETDRFINIEAHLNVLVQACIEEWLRNKLRYLGNDLKAKSFDRKGLCVRIRDTQHLHGKLISYPNMCTIDLKNASDSTLLSRLDLLENGLRCAILRSRSYCVSFPDGDFYPVKVSSMGNGFTFGLMTFLIYSSLLSVGVSSNVFGDDIIVHQDDVQLTLKVLDGLGYVINPTKTFIDHKFRESCGYFYHTDFGYIRSFDITYVQSLTDVIVTCNKYHLLAKDARSLGHVDMADIFQNAADEMSSLVPASLKGPEPYGAYLEAQNMGCYVYDSKHDIKKKRSKEAREVYNFADRLLKRLGLTVGEGYSFIVTPIFKPKITRENPKRDVNFLLRCHGIRKGTVRGRGRYHGVLSIVSPTGVTYNFAQLSQTGDLNTHDLVSYEPKLPV